MAAADRWEISFVVISHWSDSHESSGEASLMCRSSRAFFATLQVILFHSIIACHLSLSACPKLINANPSLKIHTQDEGTRGSHATKHLGVEFKRSFLSLIYSDIPIKGVLTHAQFVGLRFFVGVWSGASSTKRTESPGSICRTVLVLNLQKVNEQMSEALVRP